MIEACLDKDQIQYQAEAFVGLWGKVVVRDPGDDLDRCFARWAASKDFLLDDRMTIRRAVLEILGAGGGTLGNSRRSTR